MCDSDPDCGEGDASDEPSNCGNNKIYADFKGSPFITKFF
jgi:hypothetical protein